MTEGQYVEVPCVRGFGTNGSAFSSGGLQEFPWSVGEPNVWRAKKSYFRVEMALYRLGAGNGAGAGNGEQVALSPSALTAFADNAVGGLFDNVYLRIGGQLVGSLTQYVAQASALKVRLGNTLPWLRSMGAGVAVNESSFQKRCLAISQYPGSVGGNAAPLPGQASATGTGAYDDREIYRPYAAANIANFAAGTVTTAANDTNVLTGSAAVDFLAGMPLGSAPTGGSVLPGDIIVIQGVPYTVTTVTDAVTLDVEPQIHVRINPPTADWFIVRHDPIRTPQGSNTVFAIWQPPLGIFDDDEPMGAGQYRFQLNPNTNFRFNAVETKDPNFSAISPYVLAVKDVRFYAWMEKMSIPDGVRDLYFREMMVYSKTYSPTLQFTIPQSTYAITVFVQDSTANNSPLAPPSMFKTSQNGDLYLTQIMLSYATLNRPSSNYSSLYSQATTTTVVGPVTDLASSSVLELQQRYHDSYEESGLDVASGGIETLADWLRRGPFYHFTFKKDINNKATDLQVQTTYTRAGATPADLANNNANLVVIAWYRKTCQITVSNGLVAATASRDV